MWDEKRAQERATTETENGGSDYRTRFWHVPSEKLGFRTSLLGLLTGR